MIQTMYTEEVCLTILYIWDVDDGQGQNMQFSGEDQVCFPLISVTSGASLMVDVSQQPFLLSDLTTEESGNEETTE